MSKSKEEKKPKAPAPNRQVRISDEVFAEIQKRAKPLEDTVDSVLRRVFGIQEKKESDEG